MKTAYMKGIEVVGETITKFLLKESCKVRDNIEKKLKLKFGKKEKGVEVDQRPKGIRLLLYKANSLKGINTY
jgi:hypothetical protein